MSRPSEATVSRVINLNMNTTRLLERYIYHLPTRRMHLIHLSATKIEREWLDYLLPWHISSPEQVDFKEKETPSRSGSGDTFYLRCFPPNVRWFEKSKQSIQALFLFSPVFPFNIEMTLHCVSAASNISRS